MNRMLTILPIAAAALVFVSYAIAADSTQQLPTLGDMKTAVQQQAAQEQKADTDVMQREKIKAEQAAAAKEKQKATDTAQDQVDQATQKASSKASEALGKTDSAVNSILGK